MTFDRDVPMFLDKAQRSELNSKLKWFRMTGEKKSVTLRHEGEKKIKRSKNNFSFVRSLNPYLSLNISRGGRGGGGT